MHAVWFAPAWDWAPARRFHTGTPRSCSSASSIPPPGPRSPIRPSPGRICDRLRLRGILPCSSVLHFVSTKSTISPEPPWLSSHHICEGKIDFWREGEKNARGKNASCLSASRLTRRNKLRLCAESASSRSRDHVDLDVACVRACKIWPCTR